MYFFLPGTKSKPKKKRKEIEKGLRLWIFLAKNERKWKTENSRDR